MRAPLHRALAPAVAGAALLLVTRLVLAADLDVTARAFELRHRNVADAAELVTPILSPEGTVTVRPGPRTLVVQDHPAVLERIAALLLSYDLPPQNVEITLSLFLGRRSEPEDPAGLQATRSGLSREIRGVMETLSDFTKWTEYEPLGSRSVTGVEGQELVATLSDEFRVVVQVGAVHEAQGLVQLDRVVLQQLRRDEDGAEQIRDVFSAATVLPTGRLRLIGAAKDPHSKRALFLALQTRPR